MRKKQRIWKNCFYVPVAKIGQVYKITCHATLLQHGYAKQLKIAEFVRSVLGAGKIFTVYLSTI